MNEQFENLMYHAGLTASGCWDQMDSYDHTAIEKFAELIVQECAEFANEHNEEIEGVTLGVGQALKKHFGVKE